MTIECIENKRSNLIDILKGIGILSVIVGHVAGAIPFINMFVYTYNIMIFCFASGLVYSEEKYLSKPKHYIGKRVFGVIKYFIVYNTIFVIIHNTLCQYGLIGGAPYTFTEIYLWIFLGFVTITNESMLGGFWFLDFYVILCILISFIMYISYKIDSHNNRIRRLIQIVLVFLCAIFGLDFNMKGLSLPHHLQIALLAVPVFYIGMLCNEKLHILSIMMCRVGYLSCAGILIYLIKKFKIIIELSNNAVNGYYSFYLITAIGISFCVCLGRCIENNKRLNKVICFIGKNSIHYMALHFFMFKIFDLFATKWYEDSFEVRKRFAVSYGDIWYIYIVVCIVMITALLLGYQFVKDILIPIIKEQILKRKHIIIHKMNKKK